VSRGRRRLALAAVLAAAAVSGAGLSSASTRGATETLPAGWAAGGQATDPQSQVDADTTCGANSVLLFTARGSGDIYGGDAAHNKIGAWTQGAGIQLISKGWNVRDLQAIYPAPGVPSFKDIAAAVIAGGGITAKSAAAVGLILKTFRDAASNSWQSVMNELTEAYARCPTRKIVIAGYSQGAILLRYIIRRLDPSVLQQIVSVDLFADPTEQRSVDSDLQHPTNLDGRLTNEGIDTFSGRVVNAGSFKQTAYPTAIAPRVFQYCVDGDLVCDFSAVSLAPSNLFNEGKIHASYGFELGGIVAGRRLGSAATAGNGSSPGGVPGVSPGTSPVMLVVDISGSMGDDDGTGRTKIDGAKLALLNFLQEVEPGTPIGLRTFPDASGSCDAGTVRSPLAPRDPASMSAVIRSLTPYGDTPTADALRAAAADLMTAGYTHGTIVLVSDGESTCSPNPCDVARQIAKSGFDLQTITVGFRISATGKQELQCIANATNGAYLDVSDSAGLKDALQKVSRPSLDIALDYPSTATAEAGDDPQGLVDVKATITNTADQAARNAVASMRFDGASPGLTRPVVMLGNLDPGGSRTVTWSFSPGFLLSNTSLKFSVAASADNALSDSVSSGAIRIEDVSSAADAGPILKDRHRLAILGDSYSSGEGSDRYIFGTDTADNHCHRSSYTLLMQAFHQPESSVIACSGAVINDLYFANADNHVPSQLDQLGTLEQTRGVDAVLMTLGGNDAAFSHLAVSCFLIPRDCSKVIVPDFVNPLHTISADDFLAEEVTTDLRDHLVDAYTAVNSVLNSSDAVKSRGSVAPILVPAYALPVPLTGRSCLAEFDQLTSAETVYIGRFESALNAMVEAATIQARQENVPVFFVPTTELAFQPDHTICDDQPDARGLTSVNGAGFDLAHLLPDLLLPWGNKKKAALDFLDRSKQELLHPNLAGYTAESNAIIRWSLSPAARVDATWLQSADASHVPALSIATSADQLGQFAPSSTPVLQGSTSYPLQVGGFAPGSSVEITVHSASVPISEVVADDRGTVSATVGIPPDLEKGRHAIEVSGPAPDGSGRTVVIPFDIQGTWAPLGIRVAAYGGAAAAIVALLAWVALWIGRRRSARSPKSVVARV